MSQTAQSTLNMSREAWLELRRKGIGGSDAAAILGMNPYKTPFSLWTDKMGMLPEAEINERMRLGIALEPYVAERFTEITGKKVRRDNRMLFSQEHPFAFANIDRAIIGEKAGLEIKTTSSLNLKRFQGGEYPEEYYVQCVHYLAVTGWNRWYLCVLVLGSPEEPKIFTIERNPEEISALMEAEKAYWEGHVLTENPPPVDGYEATTKAITALYPGGDDSTLGIDEPQAIAHYLTLHQQIEALKKEKEKMGQTIKVAMGDHERAECGLYKISWAQRTKTTFDPGALAKAHPQLDLAPFYKTTAYRDFRIKEASGK